MNVSPYLVSMIGYVPQFVCVCVLAFNLRVCVCVCVSLLQLYLHMPISKTVCNPCIVCVCVCVRVCYVTFVFILATMNLTTNIKYDNVSLFFVTNCIRFA